MQAANVQLKDIMNYNKKKTAEEVQNFFLLQEVYGHQYAINYFEPVITPLSMQRRKTVNDYAVLKTRVTEQLNRLEEQTNDPEKEFGAIYKDL